MPSSVRRASGKGVSMKNKHSAPRVLFPRTVGEAIELAISEPNAVYWAGGTILAGSSGSSDLLLLPRTVISLGLVEELAKASRSEHNLEIGAMMTLDRLASIGRSVLPVALPEAIATIGNRPIRCRATLGGHLAASSGFGDLRTLLQILDAVAETRFLRDRKRRRKPVAAARKLPVGRLEAESGLRRGELVTKIIIPTGNWNLGDFRRIGPDPASPRKIIFAGLARVEKGMLAEWRMAFSSGDSIVRDRELEIGLSGRPLPMSSKELDTVEDSVEATAERSGLDEYGRRVVANLARGFLRKAAG